MSRKINLLNNAKNQRAEEISPPGKEILDYDNRPTARVSRVNTPWMVWIVLIIVFAIVAGANLRLYSTIRGYSYDRDIVLTKLSQIEKKISENQGEIKLLSTVLKKVVAESENQTAKISKLEKLSEAQSAAISNLIKAKDTLFNRISALEAASSSGSGGAGK